MIVIQYEIQIWQLKKKIFFIKLQFKVLRKFLYLRSSVFEVSKHWLFDTNLILYAILVPIVNQRELAWRDSSE